MDRALRRIGAPVALMLLAAMGCRPAPRRVTTDDGRCSVVMPGAPTYGEATAMIAGIALKEQSWGVSPADLSGIVQPTDVTAYVLRRATAPNRTASVGPRMLNEVGRRFVRALESQSYQPPTVRTLHTGAVEVRASMHDRPSLVAARFFPVPDGYCEVSIYGARSDAHVTAYFDSATVKP